MPRQTKQRSCTYCGQSMLVWKSFNGSWRLADMQGELHRCDADKRAAYKAARGNVPPDVRADPMPQDEGAPAGDITLPGAGIQTQDLKDIAAQGQGTEQSEQQGEGQGQGQPSQGAQDMASTITAQSEGQTKGEIGQGPQPQPGKKPEGDSLYPLVQGHVLEDIDKKQAVFAGALAGVLVPELDKLRAADATLAQAITTIDARVEQAVKAHVSKPRIVKITLPDKGPEITIPEDERPEMADLVIAYHEAKRSNMGVMLVGPAGTGKTTAALKLSKLLDLRFYPQSVSAQTSKSDLLGYMDANGRYVVSVFRKAFNVEGKGGLFLLDEGDAGNPNVLTTLNAGIGNRYCSFPDDVVECAPEFGCLMACNTYGNGASRLYVGRNQLDAATLDRFVVLNWDYDHKLEARLGEPAWVERIHKLRAVQESLGLRIVLSTRAIIAGTNLLRAGMSQKKMEDLVLWNRMNEDDREKLQAAS